MLPNEKGQKHSVSDTKRSVRVGNRRRFFFYLLGKDYNPCFTKRYTMGNL